jgi:cellulose synthase/poly-beta-1,6-N-acetylglucosamine synthase-like glycosyltransferase
LKSFIAAEALLITVLIIILIVHYYCGKNLSNSAAEKLPRLETLIFIKNAEDVIEGIVKDFYSKQEMTSELLIVDCGSSDQTHRILERLARRYLGMKFILLSDLPLNSCIQEALKYTSSPALLLIDCKSMSSKEILKSLALVSKNIRIGLKAYEK